jgi:peptide-methionine (S)-S-oxide reductase
MTSRFDAARRLSRSLAGLALLVTVSALVSAGSARAAQNPPPSGRETAVLAGGCFWGMEDVFEKLKGVTEVVVGYSGGSAETAHYETVSSGTTGHAESVKVTFDPARISYGTLLDVYFRVAHDPTERDRQGPDEGTQYRSAIFYSGEAQRRAALAAITTLSHAKAFSGPIVTEVVPLRAFYPAEEYHQHFADRNPSYPYIVAIDAPKVAELRTKFPQLLKQADE